MDIKRCIAYNTNNKRCSEKSLNSNEWPCCSLCQKHYNNLRESDEEQVLFVHTTTLKNIKQILQSNKLESYNKTKNAGIGEGDEIMNSEFVYTTILFDYFRVAIPDSINNVFLFFDKTILTKNTPSHFCSRWEWGNITDECIVYNQSIDLNENIKEWSEKYKKDRDVLKVPQNYIYGPQYNFSGVSNEVVFLDSVNFESLVGIYCKDAKWKHPLLMTNQTQLKKFLNKYGIKDADTNPGNNYFVDFSVDWDEDKHKEVEKKWLDWASKQSYKSPELNKWKKYYIKNN